MALTGRRLTLRRLLIFSLCLIVTFLMMLYAMYNTTPQTALNINKVDAGKQRSKVDLVIVEEHHEVLEYWFAAAEKGLIPKSGNILLHIDAHNDMAPPEILEDYPSFRWPRNQQEVTAMMQSNDVFIEGAAMSGLFKKVIWVWPSWDSDSHDEDNNVRKVGGGWAVVTVDNKPEKTFCECEYKPDNVTKKRCFYIDRKEFSDDDYDGTTIANEKCRIVRQFVYQEIVDYEALKQITKGTLVGADESLLLDIDEDFFGCVLRGQQLLDVDVEWKIIEDINSILDELFCPTAIEHEALINNLMQEMLTILIRMCKLSDDGSQKCLNGKDPRHKAFIRSIDKTFASFGHKEALCDTTGRERHDRIQYILESFINFDVRQLEVISELGFCMQTSPRSLSQPGFQICHGANEPNTTIVTVHIPEKHELASRLFRLQRTIQAKNYPLPNMVTLCRSVRDGYAPVPYVEEIERSIIDSVLNSRPEVTFNVVYDKNLLGGKKGWTAKRKIDFESFDKKGRTTKRTRDKKITKIHHSSN